MMEDEEIAAHGLEHLHHSQKDPSEKMPRLKDQEMVGGDIDSARMRIGRRTKFCPLTGSMVDKTEEEITSEVDKEEDDTTQETL